MRIRDRIAQLGIILAGVAALTLLAAGGIALLAESTPAFAGTAAPDQWSQAHGAEKATATAEGEGEGEGETEGEGEAEGEGEGEVEPPPPVLDTVTLLSPRGNVIAPRTMKSVSVFFAAAVTLTEDAPAGTVPEVSFVLDGKEHPAVLQDGLWQTVADLPMGTSHKVAAKAQVETVTGEKAVAEGEPETTLELEQSQPLTFAVRFANDANANGYPDNPFNALPTAGDEWHGFYQTDSCARLVQVYALKASSMPTVLYMPNPANLSQLWTVTVPPGLILDNERAMLILATACDEGSLYAPEEGPSADDRPGTIVPGAGFWESHLIVSSDSGKTFVEAGPERLGAQPLIMKWNGLRPSVGNTTQLFGRDAAAESNATTGLSVIAGEDPWTRTDLLVINAPEDGGVLEAEVARGGAMALFQTPQPARLVITPGGEAGRFGFGIVYQNQAVTQQFKLTNTGSQPLSGTVTLDDPSGVFLLVEPLNYTLAPGRSTTINLQFIPPVTGNYIAVLTFTGGATSPQAMTITGSGTAAPPKAVTAFGCHGGGTPADEGIPDLLAAILAMAVLALGARRARA